MQVSNKNHFFNNKITFVSFASAMTVMFIHSENTLLYKNVLPVIPYIEYFISYTLGNLAVPTFFMMSSYLFYRNFHIDQLAPKLKRRVKSILFPYLIWNLLYFILFYIVMFFPVIRSFMITEPFKISPQVIIEAVLFHKYNTIFWFMQQLIYFIILSPVTYFLLRRKWSIILPFLFIFIGIYYPSIPNHPQGIQINMIVYWFLGCYFAIHKPTLFEGKGTKVMTFLSAFLCIILLVSRFLIEFIIDVTPVSFILSSLLLFFNVHFLWFSLNLLSLSSTKWWMQISFFIYITHPLLIDAFSKLYAHFLPDSSFFCLTNYCFAVIFSLLLITTSAKILIKYFPKLWNILNGGRGLRS